MVKATNPSGITEKIEESRACLEEMVSREEAPCVRPYLYSLSGFLSAFRTTRNRLIGVVENKHGETEKERVRDRLKQHADVEFLIQIANQEFHGDSVVIYRRFVPEVQSSTPDRWKSKWVHDTNRWESKWSPNAGSVRLRRVPGWRFARDSKNICDLCQESLTAVEQIAQPFLR